MKKLICLFLSLVFLPISLLSQPDPEVERCRTTVTLHSIHTDYTKPGDEITISGQIIPTTAAIQNPIPLLVEVQHPDGTFGFNDILYTDYQGNYQLSVVVQETGYIRVNVRFEGNTYYEESGSELIIPIKPPAGMLIVIPGGGTDYAPYFPSYEMLTDMAVTAFRRRGTPDDPAVESQNRIWYMHPDLTRDLASDADLEPDVDGEPTLANLEWAIKNWALELIQTKDDHGDWWPEGVMNTPLTIYLIGNFLDNPYEFPINDTESLSGELLDEWLDELEGTIIQQFIDAGISPPSYVPMNVIADGFYSGSVIEPLSQIGRFIVTSTNGAICDNPRPELCGVSYFASGGSVSFSSYFLSRIATGNYIHPSYEYARLNIEMNGALVGQDPQLEATGEGIPNQIADEIYTSSQPLEYRSTGNARPLLQNALGQITLRNIPSAGLWVYVDDPEDEIATVEASIIPPDGSYEESHVIGLTENATKPNRFEGIYDKFYGEGIYTILYTLTDNAGNFATPLQKTVIMADDVAPLEVTNLTASYISGTNSIVLTWNISSSDDAQGYLVKVTYPDGNSTSLDAGNVDRFTLTDIDQIGNYEFRVSTYDRNPLYSPEVVANVETFNTLVGENVQVTPKDLTTGNEPVELIFANVTENGNTTLETDQSGSAIPPGFSFGDPVIFFNIGTSAQYTGTIQIIIDYSEIVYENEPGLRIFHYENNAWTDVTTSVDIENDKIYGEVTSLSSFVILQDNKPPTVLTRNLSLPLNESGKAILSASDIDNGSTDENGIASMSIDITEFNCSQVGENVVTLTVTDIYGNSATETATVTILDNLPPTIICPTDITQTTDPGRCDAYVSVPSPMYNDNCGEAVYTNDFNGTNDASGIYSVGTTIVTWAVTDGSGNLTTCQMNIEVNDIEPPGIIAPNKITKTNDFGKCSAAFNLETPVVSDNCGVKDIINDSPGEFPVGATTVTWTATDIHSNQSTANTVIEIINEAPIISNISAPIDPVQINYSINATATYLDNNLESATWDWGDGLISQGIIDTNIGGEHVYTGPGVYTIALLLVDLCGKSTASIYQYVVVYDPYGGFVTGGGWIYSPQGASTQYPFAEGKANFGFVAKYKKGSTIPTGNTEFQFKAGNLNFNSCSYDWLVIAGPQAKFKGEGTVNGMGDYGFLLSARDGEANGGGGSDKFRIKIWDRFTGVVIYDNQMGLDDGADPTTNIEAGSIVIHSGEATKSGSISKAIKVSDNDALSPKIEVYPNPFSVSAIVALQYFKSTQALVTIYDLNGRLIKQLYNGNIEEEIEYRFEFTPDYHLDNGIYIIKVVNPDNAIYTKTLILLR